MSDDQKQQQGEEGFEPLKPIDKWDGSAVKNRLDDAVKYLFTGDLQYEENFILIDFRLLISSNAVFVATFALVWDYLNPFPASRPVLLACVGLYFFCMVVLTIYTTMVEGGIFLKASKGNKTVTVSSNMNRFDDIYKLCLEVSTKDGDAKSTEVLENTVAKWFDEKGYFLERRFEEEVRALLAKAQRKN